MPGTLLLAGFSAFGLMCSTAAAAEKPVRQLVFEMTVAASTDSDALSWGGTGWNLGNPTVARTAVGGAEGAIHVDILSEMPDHSFVAIVSETTRKRTLLPVRVVVDSAGSVFYGRADVDNFRGEERLLLHFLTPELVTRQKADLGSWTAKAALADGDQEQTFKVTGAAPDGNVRLQLNENIHVGGAHRYETEVHATMLYNAAQSVPKNIIMQMRESHWGMQGTEVSALSATYDLTSDTTP